MTRGQEIDKLIEVTKSKTTAPVTVTVDGFDCTVFCSYFDAKPFFSLWISDSGVEWYRGTMSNSSMHEGYMRSLLSGLRDKSKHIKRLDSSSILLLNS